MKQSRFLLVLFAAGLGKPASQLAADESPSADLVRKAQDALISTIEKIAPTAVCVHDASQRGGGSGVLIDPQGYGLTNFHVVAGMLEKRTGYGGLSNGKLYEMEILGIDPVGDLAMFRLKGDQPFPYAPLGDSDQVQIGDTVIAAGNPFILSEDYTPSISVGLVSGTHRYQRGVGGNLIYSDCIQTDAAINPGNSGGALFNTRGEIIGINGRISVGARGRLNVGHGYAISSNQVRRFIPALRAGMLARHGTLGCGLAETEPGRVILVDIVAGGAADRAGLRNSDRLTRFDGAPVHSQNIVASMLGTYPEDWPVKLDVETESGAKQLTVRLDPVNPKMRTEFVATPDVNLDAVRRVLDRFRQAVLRDAATAELDALIWRAERRHLSDDGTVKYSEVFDVSGLPSGQIQMVRRYDDGSRGFAIVFDEAVAEKHLDQAGQKMDLPTGDRIVLNALHVMQFRLLQPLMPEDLAGVVHLGADAPRHESAQAANAFQDPLEVIEWPIGIQTVARYSFEPGTGRLVRIRARDVATNEQATVELSDYRWAAGMSLPHLAEVRTSSSTYHELRSNWDIR